MARRRTKNNMETQGISWSGGDGAVFVHFAHRNISIFFVSPCENSGSLVKRGMALLVGSGFAIHQHLKPLRHHQLFTLVNVDTLLGLGIKTNALQVEPSIVFVGCFCRYLLYARRRFSFE